MCSSDLYNKIKENKINLEDVQVYTERYSKELDIFESVGLVDYILLVWDELDFCRRQNIPLGWGRGSVCGSLVCYLVGIHNVDSIKHGLFFERFLSAVRAKKTILNGVSYVTGNIMLDVDVDTGYYQRGDVIKYLDEKYQNKTSKLLALTSFSGKILIKDCLKILEEVKEEDAQFASDLLEKTHGVVEEISDAATSNDKFKLWAKNHEQTVKVACKLSGLIRSKSQHPSAVLISYDEISKTLPLELSQGKEVISSYDMYVSQDLVVKLDNLGLKTLSVLYEACNLIGIKPLEIDVNHQSIYD